MLMMDHTVLPVTHTHTYSHRASLLFSRYSGMFQQT